MTGEAGDIHPVGVTTGTKPQRGEHQPLQEQSDKKNRGGNLFETPCGESRDHQHHRNPEEHPDRLAREGGKKVSVVPQR